MSINDNALVIKTKMMLGQSEVEKLRQKIIKDAEEGVVIIPEFFDMDEYRQQLTDEICALIESFKLSGFNEEQALKLTEVYCRQGVNLVLLDLTRMKNVEKEK